MAATLSTIPADFLSGGKGLTPNQSAGDPDLLSLLQELQGALANAATGMIQRGTATLASGTATVDTTIVLGANSRIFVSMAERPTGSTNFAGIAVVSTTTGAAGVATFTIEALVAAGTIDADAAGDVNWMIID